MGEDSPDAQDDDPLPMNGSSGAVDLLSGADEMATESAPSNRVKSRAPAAPLPRLWKAEPDPETEPPAKKAAASGSKSEGTKSSPSRGSSTSSNVGKIERIGTVRSQSAMASSGKRQRSEVRSRDSDDGQEKKALIEETPTLDTYEARQYARVIFGVVGLGVCGVIGLIIYASVRSKIAPAPPSSAASNHVGPSGFVSASPSSAADRDRLEQEARLKFDQARAVARAGKVTLAIETLKSVIALYPGTKAAAEAKEVLDRPSRNLPLFSDVPTVVATSALASSGPKPDRRARGRRQRNDPRRCRMLRVVKCR